MGWIPVLFVFLCSAAAQAQTISGRVYDQSGAAVSGARVVLLEDFRKLTETKSGDKGDFSFRGLRPATYQVQVKQPSFQIFQQVVLLQENQDGRVYAVLHVARAADEIGITSDPLPDVSPQAGGNPPHRPGGKVEGLKRMSGRMPAWPEAARGRGAEGDVVVYGTVKSDGTIGEVTVLESADPDLEKAAVEAYQTWKYEPMKLNGRPVACRHVAAFRFRYR